MSAKLSRRAGFAVTVAAAAALTACNEGEAPRPPTPDRFDRATIISAARELADDAVKELSDAFGGLEWVDTGSRGCDAVDGGSRVRIGTWRTDRYLGREQGDGDKIHAALASACEKHGLPAPAMPSGGTGGWLTTESEGRGLRLAFRSKGTADISVDAFVDGSCADLSDGGR